MILRQRNEIGENLFKFFFNEITLLYDNWTWVVLNVILQNNNDNYKITCNQHLWHDLFNWLCKVISESFVENMCSVIMIQCIRKQWNNHLNNTNKVHGTQIHTLILARTLNELAYAW